jgi:L-alanine-DL-glutamate epimerase-like enolase superfamily enzyme
MISRRLFLSTLPVAAAQIGKVKIKDVQVMMMQGGRTYTLIKITADNGVYGIGEAYGSPGVGVKEQVLALRSWLIGKDPLQIDTIYTNLGAGGNSLSGNRTDGSAHNLMRAASGIEMTLWDLAGKILGVPSSSLLGGRFRDKVRVYDHSAPKNMLDKASCREWAAQVKADPAGFTCHKFGFPRTNASVVVAGCGSAQRRSCPIDSAVGISVDPARRLRKFAPFMEQFDQDESAPSPRSLDRTSKWTASDLHCE